MFLNQNHVQAGWTEICLVKHLFVCLGITVKIVADGVFYSVFLSILCWAHLFRAESQNTHIQIHTNTHKARQDRTGQGRTVHIFTHIDTF